MLPTRAASRVRRYRRACNRASTAAGTSPVMFPPSAKTSFTRRELT